MRGTSPELEGRAERKKAHGIESWNWPPARGLTTLGRTARRHFSHFEGFRGFSHLASPGQHGTPNAGAGGGQGRPRGLGSAAHARALPRITPALPRITMHGSTPFSTSSARQFCAQNLSLAPPGMRPPHREPSPQGGAPRKRGGPHAHFKPVFHSCVRHVRWLRYWATPRLTLCDAVTFQLQNLL